MVYQTVAKMFPMTPGPTIHISVQSPPFKCELDLELTFNENSMVKVNNMLLSRVGYKRNGAPNLPYLLFSYLLTLMEVA